MKDPFYQDETGRPPGRRPGDVPLHWLRFATGLLALAIIAAIWIVWRWG
jgi:hypothetical protein